MLGRLLGGVATSLLFSVFEAWLIRSHADAKLGRQFLSQSFSAAAYGNSVVAILAGLAANKAASSTTMEPVSGELVYVGGYLNPVSCMLRVAYCVGFQETLPYGQPSTFLLLKVLKLLTILILYFVSLTLPCAHWCCVEFSAPVCGMKTTVKSNTPMVAKKKRTTMVDTPTGTTVSRMPSLPPSDPAISCCAESSPHSSRDPCTYSSSCGRRP